MLTWIALIVIVILFGLLYSLNVKYNKLDDQYTRTLYQLKEIEAKDCKDTYLLRESYRIMWATDLYLAQLYKDMDHEDEKLEQVRSEMQDISKKIFMRGR